MDKHQIILGLGTNTQQVYHMEEVRKLLCRRFDEVVFTRSLWTPPIGQDSPLYLNALVYAETSLSYTEAEQVVKQIERTLGRTPEDKLVHRVIIDIDILKYDNE